MKKVFLLGLALMLSLTGARADEGMWLLKLMKQQHLEDSLRKAGLQLPPEALYSETSPSLRECVGIFGGGCTGEVVSPNGLILTNHHCGFSYVHEMSGIGHDYMKDGYFATKQSEELRTPESLTFTFVLRIVDVTEEVNKAAKKAKADIYTEQSQGFLQPIAEKLLKKSDLRKKKGINVRIVPFFGGNQFYMFYEQTFQDIRLVATPPFNIGQFGGNTDNWMWPRHNADFNMFRIYADENGDPAPYSPNNVPLKVKKYLPVSLGGPKANEYTMIMGFPGTTTRYLTAAEVKLRCESTNAPMVLAGNPLLAFYKKLMDQSDELRLLLEDDYASWGNMVKNFGGMNEAVEKIDLIGQKKAEENQFRQFAKQSGKAEYDGVIERIEELCAAYADTVHDLSLLRITLLNQRLQVPTDLVEKYLGALESGKQKDIEASKQQQLKAMTEILTAGKLTTKQGLEVEANKMNLLMPFYAKYNKLNRKPSYTNRNMNELFAQSVFTDSARLAKALATGKADVLKNDPLYVNAKELEGFIHSVFSQANKRYNHERAALDRIYVRGLCEMYDWSKAPDANFTLRMTYGHACDLVPRDAVHYNWQTVLDGMFEKESKTESDYFINERLRKLYNAKDFGRYARPDGKLPTCFLSNNDITGGNSGSPVLNAKGELIGLAFDGNIESLSSDLKFNPALQRCINVDIRFVLFILDKFGGAGYAIDEMDIRP